ncbi:MAG: hypothetical protein ACRD24_11065 [Terriglobales bacterium]
MLVGAPLAGVWLTGQPLDQYLEFPPRPASSAAAGFSWTAFWLIAAFVVTAVAPIVWRLLNAPVAAPGPAAARLPFPIWGWAALLWLAASWTLAWTRFPWFESFQQHTFTPLWLGYIACINALTMQRAGNCLLTREPARFAALFPLSALFWWFFEYLNRFVGNWRYVGIEDFGAIEYTFFATLAFSTVLPAVTSTAEWLGAVPRIDTAFAHWHATRVPRPRLAAAVVLALTALSLAALGVFREYVFPLVWISPVLVIISLQALGDRATVLAPLAGGDWRGIASFSAAALVCGFFWEMWNSGSLARWEYSIPHVDRFRFFEMPLLGYAGYLPFGIECAAIAALVLDYRKSIQSRNSD